MEARFIRFESPFLMYFVVIVFIFKGMKLQVCFEGAGLMGKRQQE